MPLYDSLKRATLPLALGAALLVAQTAGAQCPVTKTHSGANFGGGSFMVQAGFAEGEGAAASFTVNAAEFPIKINLIEMIFAQSGATVSTTTQWSVFVYEGTPDTGTLLYEYSSDDEILPHIHMGPGTQGTNVQFSVDPGDPEQMFIYNTGGSNKFTVGYRIDQHNNGPANPCLQSPPTNSNAFPTTDADGNLSQPANNWLFALDCGAFGAPPGWHSFSQLPAFMRPSGDWNIRVTYESLNGIQITQHPGSQLIALGQPAIFQVVATGPGTLNYAWYKGAQLLTNGNGIFGATTDTLFIFPTVQSHAGTYRCVVSNDCGTATSNLASLQFLGQQIGVSGTVSLQDWNGPVNGRSVQIQVRNPGGATALQTQNVTLNASGGYSFNLDGSIPAGTYDFYAKASHWLRKIRASVSVPSGGASGVNFSLKNGDIDGDNEVGIGDYSVLSSAYNLSLGDAGYDAEADLNGDDSIDIADYSILSVNYGMAGDD